MQQVMDLGIFELNYNYTETFTGFNAQHLASLLHKI